MQNKKIINKEKLYPGVSEDAERQAQGAIEHLTDWQKDRPKTTFNIEDVHGKSTLFRNALKNQDYEKCAEIEGKELTKELKHHHARIALWRGYINV